MGQPSGPSTTQQTAAEAQHDPAKADSSETLFFSEKWAARLETYLPPPPQRQQDPAPRERPFVTLTYAQSLDSHIALGPGVRTALSGPASKAMTHHLRSRHDAILVGVGTAVADDPGLNCRVAGGATPRPVVLDPRGRWGVSAESKVVRLAAEGRGKAPWVLGAGGKGRGAVEGVGGRYVDVPGREEDGRVRVEWADLLGMLAREGVGSVMIEGGGAVINELLALVNRGEDVVDSVIVTIAPTWLGDGGVRVAPPRGSDGQGVPGPRLREVTWTQMGEDMVLCGKVKR